MTVLVTGATGRQGGAVARRLLDHGYGVRVLTRNPSAAGAKDLERRGAQVLAGNFDDAASLDRALEGAAAVFAMGTPYEAGPEAETRHGIALVDAARHAGVVHYLFTSIPGNARKAAIPTFESKYRVEDHLRASGVPATVLGPGFFMENLLGPAYLPGLRQGRLELALSPDRPLHLIGVEDIGAFSVLVLENRERFSGRRIDIASDVLTPARMAETLSRATGRSIHPVRVPMEAVRARSEGLAKMYAWFEEGGMDIDPTSLRRDYPQVTWQGFEGWAGSQDWSAIDS